MSCENCLATWVPQAFSNSRVPEDRADMREHQHRRLNPQDKPSSAGIRIREPSPGNQSEKPTTNQDGSKRPQEDQCKSEHPQSVNLSKIPAAKDHAKPPRVGGHRKPIIEGELGPLLPGLRRPVIMGSSSCSSDHAWERKNNPADPKAHAKPLRMEVKTNGICSN